MMKIKHQVKLLKTVLCVSLLCGGLCACESEDNSESAAVATKLYNVCMSTVADNSYCSGWKKCVKKYFPDMDSARNCIKSYE